MKKLSKKAVERKVSELYAQSCSGIQVSIFDLGKIMKVGEASVLAGDSDELVKSKLRAFVETIRKN
jgi:hypothetical protein